MKIYITCLLQVFLVVLDGLKWKIFFFNQQWCPTIFRNWYPLHNFFHFYGRERYAIYKSYKRKQQIMQLSVLSAFAYKRSFEKPIL